MRPVVMPDGWFPGSRRQIIGGENDTEPAEYVVMPDATHGIAVHTLVQLDPEEIQQIADTGYVFLSMFGGELPWNLSPAPEPGSEWQE